MLVGRAAELARLDALLAEVQGGRAQTLCLVGEPGIGKTSLLAAAADHAAESGAAVVRVTAVEPETGLRGAVLDLLLRRLRAVGSTVDPDAVAVPSLLTALLQVAAEGPLLVVVDDVQWLDEVSIRALVFAARRLLADPVGLVLAGRPEVEQLPGLAEVPRLPVAALPEEAARELLATVAPGLSGLAAGQVVSSLGAVPLALVEAGRLLTPDELAGRASLPHPLRVGPAVQERYSRGCHTLPAESRLALTVLAADDGADPAALLGALQACATSVADLQPAEAAGLVTVGARPGFVHPLARAAAYAAATPDLRRRAHAVLADAYASDDDLGRALHHRAAAATGPDERLAATLEQHAEGLASVGSSADAAAAAMLAADLTPGRPERLRRLVLVAENTPDVHRSQDLIDQVLEQSRDPQLTVRCLLALGGTSGPGLSLDGLDARLVGLDRAGIPDALRRQLDVARIWSAIEAADLRRLDSLAAELDDEVTAESWPLTATLGIAYTFVGQHRLGGQLLRRAIDDSATVDPLTLPFEDLWTWTILPGWLGEDNADHRRRVGVLAQRYRASGLPRLAAAAAFFTAERARRDGEWQRAEALFVECVDIGAALQEPEPVGVVRLANLLAYRGATSRTLALVDEADRTFGHVQSLAWNHYWVDQTRGALALTMGRPEDAVAPLQRVAAAPFVGRGCRDAVTCAGVDLVQALVSVGEQAAATAATEQLAGRLDGIADPLGVALVERCRALTRPSGADEHFAVALARHAQADDPFEQARTRLGYGEHLRRTRRARAAREQLHQARAAFDRLGARPWAERAARELAASGDTAPAQSAAPAVQLTPQELQVALAVSDGRTNAETAAALYISVKTVEFHLGRAYRKLGVRSRGGLARALEASRVDVGPR